MRGFLLSLRHGIFFRPPISPTEKFWAGMGARGKGRAPFPAKIGAYFEDVMHHIVSLALSFFVSAIAARISSASLQAPSLARQSFRLLERDYSA